MKRKLVTVFIALMLLCVLVQANDLPTEIPEDSYFPILMFEDPTGFLTTTGIRGMNSSVLATRQGIFGLDVSGKFSLANDTFGLENLSRYATDLDDALKDEIIELAGEDGISISPYTIAGANMQLSRFGLSANLIVNGQGYLSKDLVELLLKGNELNRVYNLDPNLRLAFIGDVKAQVAFKVPLLAKVFRFNDISMGFAYHHIPAGVYVVADSDIAFESVYTEDEASTEAEFTGNLFISDSAKGSAFDIGLLVRPTEKLYFAAAIDGMQGQVNWTNFRYVSLEELEETDGASIDLTNLGTPVTGQVSQKLPLTLKVGARYDVFNWLKLYGEGRQTTLADKSSYITISAGTDVTLLWVLPLKASVTYDTRYSRFGYKVGAGLKLFVIEAAIEGFTRPHATGDELGIGAAARIAF